MIKDASVIRETRGLSWQNWVTSCKNVAVDNARIFIIASLLLLAAVAGGVLAKHASSEHADKHAPHVSPGVQLNLNESEELDAPGSTTTTDSSTSPDSTGAVAANTPSESVSSTANRVTQTANSAVLGTSTYQTIASAARCDLALAAKARLTYNAGVAAENSYHEAQLALLGITSINLFSSSGKTSDALKYENDRHTNALDTLQKTYDRTLNDLHCN